MSEQYDQLSENTSQNSPNTQYNNTETPTSLFNKIINEKEKQIRDNDSLILKYEDDLNLLKNERDLLKKEKNNAIRQCRIQQEQISYLEHECSASKYQ